MNDADLRLVRLERSGLDQVAIEELRLRLHEESANEIQFDQQVRSGLSPQAYDDCVACHGQRAVYDDFEGAHLPCDVCDGRVGLPLYDDFEGVFFDQNDHPLRSPGGWFL